MSISFLFESYKTKSFAGGAQWFPLRQEENLNTEGKDVSDQQQ